MKKASTIVTLLAVIAAASAFGTSIPVSYAHNPDGVGPIPPQCLPFLGNSVILRTHDLQVLTAPPILIGSQVDVQATIDGPTNVDQVRFLWYDSTDTLVRENVIGGGVHAGGAYVDSIPAIPGPLGEWKVIACFEQGHETRDANDLHINVESFFVLPESALGAVTLVGGSFAALGGYMFLKPSRKPTP